MSPNQQTELTDFFSSTPAPPNPAVETPAHIPPIPPPAPLEPVVNLTTASPPPAVAVGSPLSPSAVPSHTPGLILPTATTSAVPAVLSPPAMTTAPSPTTLASATATTTAPLPPIFNPATVPPPPIRPMPLLYSDTRPPARTNRRVLYDLVRLLPTHSAALEDHLRALLRTTSTRSSVGASISIVNGVTTHHSPPPPDLDDLPIAEVKASLLEYCQAKLSPDELDAILSSKLLTPTPAEETAARYKRALEEEDSDDEQTFTWNCNQVRRKIHAFLESGEMKVTEFQRLLGVNSNSYRRFMGFNGTWQGVDNGTMSAAYKFFKKREAEGKPIKKKAKTAGGPSPYGEMIKDIHLDGEESDEVKVYDSCDEVRKKISAHLRKPDVTQAQFLKDIAAQFKTNEIKIQSKQLNDFRNKSGADAGNTSRVFYGAYVFFEKLRIKEGKPKSKHRLDMEKTWGEKGFDTKTNNSGRGYLCRPGEVPVMNKLGTVEFYSTAPRPR